jgi:hypothetical protein
LAKDGLGVVDPPPLPLLPKRRGVIFRAGVAQSSLVVEVRDLHASYPDDEPLVHYPFMEEWPTTRPETGRHTAGKPHTVKVLGRGRILGDEQTVADS